MKLLTCILTLLVAATVAAADAPIDKILAATHQRSGITAETVCNDRAFIRRVTLDLAGSFIL